MVLNFGGIRYYPAHAAQDGLLTKEDFVKLAALYRALPSCRVTHSANQSIANNTATALAFDTETFDTHAFHDTATNNSRLTVPSAALTGVYAIFAGVEWDAAAAGYRSLVIRANGTTQLVPQRWYSPAVATFHQQSAATIYPLANGAYVEAVVLQDTGAAVNAFTATDTYLAFIRLGD